MRQKLLFWASLVGLPLAGQAQTAPASARFYVGAGANLLTNVPFTSAGTPRLIGPALTAGVYLAPSLALQASVAYHWQHESYTYPSYNYGGTIVGNDSYSNRSHYFTVPVLLRYTFTPAAERFQVDGLVGITLVHSSYHYESTTSYSGYPDFYERSGGLTRANVTLGPGVRYAVSPSVELTANGLVSAVVGDTYYRFSDRLFLNVLVGAQYSFGQR